MPVRVGAPEQQCEGDRRAERAHLARPRLEPSPELTDDEDGQHDEVDEVVEVGARVGEDEREQGQLDQERELPDAEPALTQSQQQREESEGKQ